KSRAWCSATPRPLRSTHSPSLRAPTGCTRRRLHQRCSPPPQREPCSPSWPRPCGACCRPTRSLCCSAAPRQCRRSPTPTSTRALGFSDRERRMLSYVDGEATVEDIVLASGLKADRAYKVLAVAKFLGMLEVRAPKAPSAPVSAELDVQRLEAKYEQVQDADY